MSTAQHSWYHSNNITCAFIFVVTVGVLCSRPPIPKCSYCIQYLKSTAPARAPTQRTARNRVIITTLVRVILHAKHEMIRGTPQEMRSEAHGRPRVCGTLGLRAPGKCTPGGHGVEVNFGRFPAYGHMHERASDIMCKLLRRRSAYSSARLVRTVPKLDSWSCLRSCHITGSIVVTSQISHICIGLWMNMHHSYIRHPSISLSSQQD